MLAYTFYETDNRVRRYAETLIQKGAEVDVISLRRTGQGSHEMINGVNVFRIQERTINEKGFFSYGTRLLSFLVKSALFISKNNLKKHYDLIHVHNIPDFEVFAAVIPKLSGTKIILDIHDILPEFYASKFSSGNASFFYKVLVFVEKLSASFSDHVIISNHIWEATLLSRSVKKDKCTTILNYPDLKVFHPIHQDGGGKKFILLYPGTLNWHQGLDIAIKAFSIIKEQVPDTEFHIYGEGPAKTELINIISHFGLEQKVFLKRFLPIDKIAKIMASADLGIVPKRANNFGNEAFSTKILEFMALGVPVIVSDTKIDKYYFNDSMVKYFKSEDEKDLAQAMLTMIKDEELRKRLISNAFKYIEKNNWDVKKNIYLDIVDKLVRKNKKLIG